MPHSKQTNICIVGLDWPAPTFMVNLIHGLLKHNIHITVASQRKPDQALLYQQNFRWLATPSLNQNGLKKLFLISKLFIKQFTLSPGACLSINQQSKQESHIKARLNYLLRHLPFAAHHWDLIYFPWNATAVDYLPLYTRADKILVSCRGSQINIAPLNPKRAAYSSKIRESFDKAHQVHCVSRDLKEKAIALGLNASKAIVIPAAVDIERFKPNEIKHTNNTFKIITVSSLVWLKGYEYALQIVKALVLNGLNIKYTIVGDGPARQRVQYTIRDLELQDHVSLIGKQTPSEIIEQLKQSDTFLFCSVSEGISNAVLEAMACGLPVVSSDCGGMPEVIEDGHDGFIVPRRNIHLAVKHLTELYHQPELRKNMSLAARKKVCTSFNIKDQLNSFETMIKESIPT